jgi:hypothetical protein
MATGDDKLEAGVQPQDSPVERLRRWEAHGAVWRIASRSPTLLTVSLLQCDGGTEVDTIVSSDPELFAFVGDRSASDE